MFEELGISGGTVIIILISIYFVVKWAVKNGIREAFTIKDNERKEDMKKFIEYLNNEEK